MTNPQMYETTDEIRQWSMPKAAQFLVTYTLKRSVAKNDYIQLMNNHYTVGREWARQYVTVFLDETTYEWVI